MGSGANPNNSGQAQILVYEGVLFVINGANDVFAMDVDTGEILWTYRGNPDPRSGVPMGRSSRGVAMGEGKIFVAQIDARLVALDQRTGEVVWSVDAERWQNGFSMTSAPLYYDGLVIAGFSGGEMASRGRVKAFQRERRQSRVAVQHRARARANSATTLGRKIATRGSSVARLCGRRRLSIPSSTSSISPRAIPGPTCMAVCGPATTCSASRSSPSTRTAANIAGTSSRCITTSGITTRRTPSCLFDAEVGRAHAQRPRAGVEDGLGLYSRSRNRRAVDRHRGAAP